MRSLFIVLLFFSCFGSYGIRSETRRAVEQSFKNDIEEMVNTVEDQAKGLQEKYIEMMSFVEVVASERDDLEKKLQECNDKL